jgi:hypothetical protein
MTPFSTAERRRRARNGEVEFVRPTDELELFVGESVGEVVGVFAVRGAKVGGGKRIALREHGSADDSRAAALQN